MEALTPYQKQKAEEKESRARCVAAMREILAVCEKHGVELTDSGYESEPMIEDSHNATMFFDRGEIIREINKEDAKAKKETR